jgi:hypothetical protein
VRHCSIVRSVHALALGAETALGQDSLAPRHATALTQSVRCNLHLAMHDKRLAVLALARGMQRARSG